MKILICEDDVSTIEVLKKEINFENYNIDTILEAYNGKMAMEIIEKENPEFVLSDIGMPLVNGVEVLKFAKTFNNNIEFAFLTCYEDFEYAHVAIEYDVAGYITKPFRLQQVENVLKKMTNNYKEKVNGNENQIKKDLLSSTVFQQIADGLYGTDQAMIQEFLNNNDMSFNADKMFTIVFTCLNIIDVSSNWSKDLLLFTAARVHDETLNNYVGAAHTIVDYDDRFLWVITFIDNDVNKNELEKRCEVLTNFCDEHFSIKPVILISNSFPFYKTADVVSQLYGDIRKIRLHGGKIFHQNDSIDEGTNNISTLNEYELLWCLKNRDNSSYEECINKVLASADKTYDLSNFKRDITLFFLTAFKDNGLSNEVIFENERIKRINDETENKSNMLEYACELMNIYQQEVNQTADSESIILRAKRFVDDNYRDDIDRDDVAKVAFVTPNYLSKLFRNNMGMNLRKYINNLRVEEAKRLLLSTNMPISEIAIYVGYYNISYFSTIFHDLVGVSPAEWRESGQML